MKTTASSVLSNFLWRFIERTGAQIVGVIVSIILARILSPTDYGTIALMSIVINVLGVFIDAGLGTALIQKIDADDIDFSSVFYANLFLCIILYIFLFIFSNRISTFYNKPEMTLMIKVSGLSLIISGIKNIQIAYVSRTMQFKRFFFATISGTIGAAFIGIMMAINGFGVWSLIIQSLFNNTIDTIVLWFTVKWRPKKLFSFTRMIKLFNFGWKLLASSIIDTIYGNLRSLVIGKVYSSEDLAYFNKGKTWPYLIVSNVNTSISSVLLPSMSLEQNDKDRVKLMTRRSIQVSTYIMAPLLLGMASCSKILIKVILTDKWLPAVPFQIIFCISFFFWPIHTANLNAIKAMGRSDIFFKLEILKKIISIILIILTVKISVLAVGYSMLFSSVVSQLINTWPNKKILDYGYFEQIKDILPCILLVTIMSILVYGVSFLNIPDILILFIQVPLGAFIYICGSILFHFECYEYVFSVLKNFIKK